MPPKDAVPAAAFGIRGQTQFGDIRRRFFRNKLAVLGLAMVAIVFFLAALAPLVAPADPRAQNLKNTTAKPSAAHWLGTDELGRDQLSRVVYGSRIAIVVGLTSIVLALLLGVILGSIAGYRGGRADSIVMIGNSGSSAFVPTQRNERPRARASMCANDCCSSRSLYCHRSQR